MFSDQKDKKKYRSDEDKLFNQVCVCVRERESERERERERERE